MSPSPYSTLSESKILIPYLLRAQNRRCGWDCEGDGYDDNSNPLPKYAAKYRIILEVYKEGRTPEWKGKARKQ